MTVVSPNFRQLVIQELDSNKVSNTLALVSSDGTQSRSRTTARKNPREGTAALQSFLRWQVFIHPAKFHDTVPRLRLFKLTTG